MVLAYLGLLLLALVAGAFAFRRTEGSGLERVVNTSLPVLACVLAASVWHAVWTAPAWNWNAVRLAPSVALWQGEAIYQPADDGPVSGHIYPPVPVWLLLPAACLPTPSSAVRLATLLTFIVYIAPAAWLLLGSRGPPAPLTLRGYLLGLFLLITLLTPALNYSAVHVHVDGPAFGFAAAACAVLYVSERPGLGVLFLSALFAVLALGSKQTMLPLVVALPLWLVLQAGWSVAFRYVVCLAIAGLLVVGLALLSIDADAAWFNLVVVPGRHPPRGAWLTTLASAFLELQEHVLLFASFLLLAGGYAAWSSRSGSWRDWLAANHWSLFLLMAIFLLPTALLGRVKVGGDVNAFGAVAGFLALALCLCLRAGCGSEDERIRDTFKAPAVVLTSLLLVVLIQVNARAYLDFRFDADNEQEIVCRYLRAHPGEAYFPWDPQAHLMAEGKSYHFEYGIFDRELAGYRLSAEHFRAHVPPEFRLLCIPQNRVAPTTQAFMKEWAQPVAVPELPGFDCWQVAPGPQRAASNSR